MYVHDCNYFSVSDASLSRTTNQSSRNHSSRKNSFSRTSRNASVPNVNSSKIPTSARHQPEKYPPIKPLSIISHTPFDIYVSSDSSTKTSPNEKPEHEYVPTAIDRPVGLDFDDFVPVSYHLLGFLSTYLMICSRKTISRAGTIVSGRSCRSRKCWTC